MRNLETILKPAVFLDRDGVLTEELSYICSADNLILFPFVKKCIDKIHKKGFYAIVITNQSGIARGMFSQKEMSEMNRLLKEESGVDAIYYCPHHIEGKIKKYAVQCHCRKPEPGLIEQACRDFDIDLQESYMVGDRASDILTGKRAGLKTVLLESGYGTKNLEFKIEADYVFQDLKEFVQTL